MTKRMMMAVVALIGLFIGIYLTLYHYGVIGELACSVGSCERVQTSTWSMLFGLPVAAWGLGYYVLVLALCMAGIQGPYADSPRLPAALAILTGWGVLFSAWLTYLEGFVIHAWCQWCLASAGLAVVLFGLAVADWREGRGESQSAV